MSSSPLVLYFIFLSHDKLNIVVYKMQNNTYVMVKDHQRLFCCSFAKCSKKHISQWSRELPTILFRYRMFACNTWNKIREYLNPFRRHANLKLSSWKLWEATWCCSKLKDPLEITILNRIVKVYLCVSVW